MEPGVCYGGINMKKQKIQRLKPGELTEEQARELYAKQAREFGFLAVVNFWRNLTVNASPEKLREEGDAYVQRVAEMIATEMEGEYITPHMAEALTYAGLCVRKEWLQ